MREVSSNTSVLYSVDESMHASQCRGHLQSLGYPIPYGHWNIIWIGYATVLNAVSS